jgi:hypothetical protein
MRGTGKVNSKRVLRQVAAFALAAGMIGVASQRAEASPAPAAGVVTTGLVLDMDANISGNGTAWTPDGTSPLGTGTLGSVSPGANPVFNTGTSSGKYYTFNAPLSGGHYGGGNSTGFSGNSSAVYLDGSTPFSMEQWVRPNATDSAASGGFSTGNQYNNIFAGDYSNANVGIAVGMTGMTVGANPSELLFSLSFRGSGTGNPFVQFSTSSAGGGVTPGVWNQLVETYTPTGGSTTNSTQVGTISMYDDGHLVASVTNFALPANGSNPEPIIPAAGSYGVGSRYLNGPSNPDTNDGNADYAGDFAINRVYAGYALTANDVLTNYDATITDYPGLVPEPSVVGLAIGGLGFAALRRRRQVAV